MCCHRTPVHARVAPQGHCDIDICLTAFEVRDVVVVGAAVVAVFAAGAGQHCSYRRVYDSMLCIYATRWDEEGRAKIQGYEVVTIQVKTMSCMHSPLLMP